MADPPPSEVPSSAPNPPNSGSSPRHRLTFSDLTTAPDTLSITGDEAHHALRVKRLAVGDPVEIIDGQGQLAHATLAASSKRGQLWEAVFHITSRTRLAPLSPQLEVCAPPPKGDRFEGMIDQLSQVGAAVYRPLLTRRTIVDPRSAKLERLQRVALEASKQCGRAWTLTIAPPLDFSAALIAPVVPAAHSSSAPTIILADASGTTWCSPPVLPASIRLLIGPEGGFTPDELHAARAASVHVHRFGPHIMRVETAAPMAAAVLLASSREAAITG